MYAVLKSVGKQFKVSPGDTMKIDKIVTLFAFKSMKINEIQWKSMKFNENQWKSQKINEIQWKPMKFNENSIKINEIQWNSIKNIKN